jgi:hypothetical protein
MRIVEPPVDYLQHAYLLLVPIVLLVFVFYIFWRLMKPKVHVE